MARLVSLELTKPPVNSGCTLTFYYYMATDGSSLNVYLNDKTGSVAKFSASGATSNVWNKVTVAITAVSQYTITFEATTSRYNAYVAIDDIKFNKCPTGQSCWLSSSSCYSMCLLCRSSCSSAANYCSRFVSWLTWMCCDDLLTVQAWKVFGEVFVEFLTLW